MIDKKITYALILALVVESAGLFAWAGATDERLKEAEARLLLQAEMSERLVRVEVKLEQAGAQLSHIVRKLEN